MEKTYWLGRKRASLKSASGASTAQARLIHYDLAGRYSVKAAAASMCAVDLGDSPPIDANAPELLATAHNDA